LKEDRERHVIIGKIVPNSFGNSVDKHHRKQH